MAALITWGVFLAFVGVALRLAYFAMFVVVPEGYAAVTEVLGKRYRTLQRGPHFLVPVFERPKQLLWTTFAANERRTEMSWKVPLMPQTLDPPPVNVMCSGRVVVEVDTILRWRVKDVSVAPYASCDITGDLYEQLRSALADVAAGMTIDDLAARPSSVTDTVAKHIDRWCKSSGIEIVDVLVQGIRYPKEVEAATHVQVARRIEAESAMAAQHNQQKLETAKTKHSSELRAIENESIIAHARASYEASKFDAQACLAKADAVAEAERRKLAAIVASGVPIPADFLTCSKYAEAWMALASAPNVQKIIIPHGAVPFLGSSGVLDVREWMQKPAAAEVVGKPQDK